MFSSPVPPEHADWSAWATLSNSVSDALRKGAPDQLVLLSARNRIARVLWDDGYRPSEEQIQDCRDRQQAAGERMLSQVVE